MDKLNIIIADKHPTVRIGLERLLRVELALDATITHCKELSEASRQIKKRGKPVDLLLAGHAFKDVDEIRLLLDLSLELFGYEIPLLVFSALDEFVYAPLCLAAGAVGFVHKSAWFPTIIDAIDTAIKGGYFVDGRPLRRQADRHALLHERNNPLHTLSARELEICRFLAKHNSCQEIGEALNIHRSTVGTYKARIFRKLKVTTDTQFVQLWNGFQDDTWPKDPPTGRGPALGGDRPQEQQGGLLLRNVLGRKDGKKGTEDALRNSGAMPAKVVTLR